MRIKQGDVNPKTGLMFWRYKKSGGEDWVTPDVFAERRCRARDACRRSYHRDIEKSRSQLRKRARKKKYWKSRASKEWVAQNKHKIRGRRYERTYGITGEQYHEMLVSQSGVCAICGNEQVGGHRLLCVDHCHNSGQVRGLLCVSCNTGLGQFKDNPEFLKSAIRYLKEHKRKAWNNNTCQAVATV